MQQRAIFLDRDGVINQEKNYLFKKDDFEFIDGIFDACKYFSKLNYKIIIITNQSGIARGYYSKKDFETLTNWMLKQFKIQKVDILDVFYCPHSPDENCNCRKPMPGMLHEAENKYNLDLKNSWLIGDKEDDILAANNSGISKTILVQSGHKINLQISNATYILKSIHASIKVIKS
jgi:D-glycero-D-manno-heptose 1,7-bisphosphate phosphatase